MRDPAAIYHYRRTHELSEINSHNSPLHVYVSASHHDKSQCFIYIDVA